MKKNSVLAWFFTGCILGYIIGIPLKPYANEWEHRPLNIASSMLAIVGGLVGIFLFYTFIKSKHKKK